MRPSARISSHNGEVCTFHLSKPCSQVGRQPATTTPADRQRIARLLLERVVVAVDKASERVAATLHWVGGTVQSHTSTRPVAAVITSSRTTHGWSRDTRVVYRAPQLGRYRPTVERGRVPSAETDEAVHQGNGPSFDGPSGVLATSAAWQYDRAGRRLVPAQWFGPAFKESVGTRYGAGCVRDG